MTINDPILSSFANLVHEGERQIDYQTREGMDKDLYLSYLKIRNAAEYAMSRLKEIKPGCC